MSQNNDAHSSQSRLRLVVLASAALLVAAVVSAALLLPGWQTQKPAEIAEEPQPLPPQEVAAIKAVVHKETGATVRYVGSNLRGTVDVFTGGPGERGFAYRVKKVEGRWRVIEKFMAFSA